MTFVSRFLCPQGGRPDDKYCMEELRAELGAIFLMGDIGIPPAEKEMYGAAAYLEGYLMALKGNPGLLFRIASDAEKASEYLFKGFQKVYDLKPEVELIPDKKTMSREKDLQPAKEPDNASIGSWPGQTDAAKAAPVL